MRAGAIIDRSPAVGLVGAGAVSVQFGAALATKLFDRVGPAGAATLRLVLAAAVLIALPGATRVKRWSDLAVAAAFGLVLAAMNVTFYESIARIPLGVAVTVEFSGPLVLALASSRRWLDALWAVLAGSGVALLAAGGRHLDDGGIALALLAGCFWIGYILLSRETGRRFEQLHGLAWALVAGGAAILPWGLVSGGAAVFRPEVIGLGAAVALLSSVVPYSLEMIALRRVDPRPFGVMLSLDPALATAAGFAVLGQHLTVREWVALGLVVAANLGNSLAGPPELVTSAP